MTVQRNSSSDPQRSRYQNRYKSARDLLEEMLLGVGRVAQEGGKWKRQKDLSEHDKNYDHCGREREGRRRGSKSQIAAQLKENFGQADGEPFRQRHLSEESCLLQKLVFHSTALYSVIGWEKLMKKVAQHVVMDSEHSSFRCPSLTLSAAGDLNRIFLYLL